MGYALSDLTEAHHAYFASLKGSTGHLRDGLFIAEGPKIVESVLRSDAKIPFGLMTNEYLSRFEPLLAGRHNEVTQVHVASKPALEKIVGFSLHQGVMLAVRIPEQPALSDLLAGESAKTIVVLEGIADAENMGTLIRTAAGFGVDAVIVDETSCHPFLRRSVRVSMGAVVSVPVIRTVDLQDTLQELTENSVYLVAAALEADSVTLAEVKWQRRTAVIFGAEGTGLSTPTLHSSHVSAMIPMAKNIDSFNVGVASGIFLHERYRDL